MLAGTLAAAFVAGVQAQGIGCSLKHFAAKSSMAKVPTLAAPELDSCTSSERAWRLCAARHSQGEAQPLGAPPRPQLLERAASKVADLTAFDQPGASASTCTCSTSCVGWAPPRKPSGCRGSGSACWQSG